MTLDATPHCRDQDLVCRNLQQLVALLESRGEVDSASAQFGLPRARAVAVITDFGDVCSMGALKNHTPTRIRGLATKFQAPEIANITTELGYIATAYKYEGNGFSSRIVDALLAKTSGPILATVRTTNPRMTGILQRRDFTPVGEPAPSTMHPGETLQAYIRGL